jgi:C-terminal processing protease CtpA/Prc
MGSTWTSGPKGTFVHIVARQPDGARVTLDVPRVERAKYASQIHEARPAQGSEVAPGVFYVDSATLTKEAWEALLPKLASALGLVCDLRGATAPDAFQVLAHFVDHEIRSPHFNIPIIDPVEQSRYEHVQLSLFPVPPKLPIKLVFAVDGRTLSASETMLQYARPAHIGELVGEPTGGTNGNIAIFDTTNGLRVRFTGMQVLNVDRGRFHGKGFAPDVTVHPTADGIRAGKDEILEAAIRRALGH